ncbi:hypothetical protein ML373_24350, partial [Escherichia coli]|uniref:hypothetical protein n=1 Tax=Escherichia coli TaxID=562 RepID=UPI001F100BF5
PDGDITRYRYDNPHSDLPCATEDATGSRKTMTWSRYGQLLSFTDCSGYQTRYDHDRFGRYELTTAYTPAGQLQSQHLNSLLSDRDYTWNDNGELIRISSPRQTRSYSYSTT